MSGHDNEVFRVGEGWIPANKNIKHGTYSAYSNQHCRCEACREAHNEWHRAYRASNTGRESTLRANRKSRLIQQLCAQHIRTNDPTTYLRIVQEATLMANDPKETQ